MDKGKSGIRHILVIAVFIIIIGGLFVLNLTVAPPAMLEGERRAPARFPRLSFETVISAEFMERFEDFAADSFVFRDCFRAINSALVFGVFLQTDKNGLYLDSGGAGEFGRTDPDTIEQTAGKIQTVAGSLDGVNIYYAFIPDKSIYSSMETPGFDPALTEKTLTEKPGMDEYTYIRLTGTLSAGSYYRTDLHWDQVKISGVLDALGASMGFDADLSGYSAQYAGEFQGVYSGQLALPIGTDDFNFLSSPSLSAMYLNERAMELEPGPVYDWDKISGLDPYDFFLSGVQPLIILENNESASDNVLYLFRDSFSSSLAPLLASAYSKVVLIDLRYIDMRALSRLVEFAPGSDALFLYSTQVLNNPAMLLVN